MCKSLQQSLKQNLGRGITNKIIVEIQWNHKKILSPNKKEDKKMKELIIQTEVHLPISKVQDGRERIETVRIRNHDSPIF